MSTKTKNKMDNMCALVLKRAAEQARLGLKSNDRYTWEGALALR